MTPEETLFAGLKALGTKAPTAPTEGSPEEEVVRLKGEPDGTKPVNLRNLFTNPDGHPVVIDFALQRQFHEDWFRWQPETLWDEITKEFSTQISELCRHKVRALQTIHTSPWPWKRWSVFEKVAQTLNGNFPDFKNVQKLSLPELYCAVDMLDTLQKEKQYSDEVRLYMAASVLEENVFLVPAPLDFIQLEVSQPHYHCNDCGTEEPALFHDGICSHCTDRMHPYQNMTMQPMQSKVAAGFGKNVSVTVRYDPASIAKRWQEVKAVPFASFQPNLEDEADMQCSRLMLARDYMNIRRKQLAEQITNLKGWLGAA